LLTTSRPVRADQRSSLGQAVDSDQELDESRWRRQRPIQRAASFFCTEFCTSIMQVTALGPIADIPGFGRAHHAG